MHAGCVDTGRNLRRGTSKTMDLLQAFTDGLVHESNPNQSTHQCKRVRKRSNNGISFRCRIKTLDDSSSSKLVKRCSKRKLAAPAAEEPVDENPAGDDA